MTHLSNWSRSPFGHGTLALLLGMLAVMGFAPHHAPEAVLLSVMGLLGLLVQATQWRQAAMIGLFYGLGLFGLGMNWLGISLTVYGGVPFGFGWLMVLGLALVLASFIAVFAGLAVYVRSALPLWAWAIFLVPSLWTLMEWLRVVLCDGFPWLLFAYSHVDTWLVSWASIGGHLAVSFVVMMSAGILWWLWHSAQWLVGMLAFACVWAISWQLSTVSWITKQTEETTPIALLHTQTPETVKWQSLAQDAMIEQLVRHTQQFMLQQPEVKVIVWPETAIPTFIDTVQPQLMQLQQTATALDVTILTGVAIRQDSLDGRRYFNSISTLDGATHYDKRHLVPFSEYYPGFSLLKALASYIGMPMAQFSEGESAQLMALHGQKVGMGVCYEVDFLHELARVNASVDWWLVVSDDGWFHPSWMAAQHWQMVRLHAQALGRDIVRVTNLGISGVAAGDGREQIIATPDDPIGVRVVQLTRYYGHTPYSRWQDMPLLGIMSFIFALTLMRFRRERKLSQSLSASHE